MTTYDNQTAWKKVEAILPEDYHYTKTYQPTEELWLWKGNRIHLDTFRNKKAKAKIICLHGVGTNGRQISMIVGGPLAKEGYETISIDMPLYGETEVKKGQVIRYDDWVQCASDLIDIERQKDDRPIFLYGLSAGGMETYHVAAKNRQVKGIIGMTFLDQRIKIVRQTTSKNAFWGRFGVPMADLATRLGFGKMKMPMKIPSKMTELVNDPLCLEVMMKDKTSAGAKVPVAFLSSYGNYRPALEPEAFDVCPVLLTQPEKDGWTPQFLSDLVLDRMQQVPVFKTKLTNGSHYPVEKEALTDLKAAILPFLDYCLKN